MRRYLLRSDGAATLDFVVVFMPLMLFILTIIELGLAFHVMVSSEKAVALGARLAATQSPVHTGVWETNLIDEANGSAGDACYQQAGDACVDPGTTWVCDGATRPESGSWGACDAGRFDAIVAELRRLHPSVTPEDMTISYVYRRLGIAGGPFVPEVVVSLRTRDMPINILSLVGLLELRPATASTLGEDLES